ncbi:MAG: outer membrane protein assembly factor BamA [Chitinispirillaceae bacterium]
MKKLSLIILLVTFVIGGFAEAKVLDSLRIEGLVINQPLVVHNAITLRKGESFTPADVQESIRKLYSLGHFRSVDLFVEEESDSGATLVLKLEENPVVESIEYHGNKKIKTKKLEEESVISLRQMLSDAQLHKSKAVIRDLYAEEGYHLAKIETELVNSRIPGNVIVKYDIDEGPRVRVKSIEFKGNEQVKSSWLEGQFKTKEKRWWRSGDFDMDTYKAHLDTLVFSYNERGFLDASIEKDSIWYSEDKKDIFIEITVNEGRKYYVGDVDFEGNKVVGSDMLASQVALEKGKPFKKSQYEMTKYLVENAYREEGHLWVRVEDKFTYKGENADTVDLAFEIYEGKPAIVRKIHVRGNSKTMEKVVRREIELLPGQKYKQSLMAQSQQNIYRLNYFDNVVPDLIPNEDGTIDLIFEITEKDNIGQLTVGAAYSDQDGLTGTFSTAIPNFRGAGQELKVDLQYGEFRKTANLGFTEPWAFDTPWWVTGRVFYDKATSQTSIVDSTDKDRYTSESYGFRAGVGRSRLNWPDDKFRVQAIYQLSHENTTYPEYDLGNLNLVESGTLSRLTLNIERYDLDMPLFPNEGSKLTITPEIAGLGGDYRYLKGTVAYEHYFQLPWKLVLGSKTKMGAISGMGDRISISAVDLFSAGGAYGDGMVRGYPDWSFGGRYGETGDGVALFSTSLQLRYPIIDQQMYLALFADMGNTWSSVGRMDLTNLYKGVGAGLRINLPMIGIMGVDVGYGLDPIRREGFDDKPEGLNWHFIMNKDF